VKENRKGMKRILISVGIILAVVLLVIFSSGFFTGESRSEESCVLCRAILIHNKIYGFTFDTIRETAMTRWYRQNIDPRHGLDPGHPHEWLPSSGQLENDPGAGTQDYSAQRVAPLFLLSPEIEAAVLSGFKDHRIQIAVIQSLNTPDYRKDTRRVNLLIQYYYVDRWRVTFKVWWARYSKEFDLPQ
jgi:hypothetical protein